MLEVADQNGLNPDDYGAAVIRQLLDATDGDARAEAAPYRLQMSGCGPPLLERALDRPRPATYGLVRSVQRSAGGRTWIPGWQRHR